MPELGAEAVNTGAPENQEDLVASDELVGVCDSSELLARIDLALAIYPIDAGIPWHTVSASVIDCGRRPGYLHDRLTALREVALYAHGAHRRVDWC